MDGLECSEVNYKDVVTSSYSSRLDSDYFKKDALAFSAISNTWESLSVICPNIKSGTTPTIRDENLKEGIVLLKTNDIRNNITSPFSKEQFFYIDEETNKKMKSSSIRSKDVLINIVGATTDVIGRVAFIPPNFLRANITQAMARLRVENKEFLPEYLFGFLLTDYAQRQTNRIARQTGQFNMNLVEVGTFRIYKPTMKFQLLIANFINKINEIQTEAQGLYQKSQQIMTELLLVSKDTICKNISIKNIGSTYRCYGRLDAEYYQPKYDIYYDILNRFKTTTISTEFDAFKNSGTDYSNGESDIRVIKTKQLTNNTINTDSIESFFDKSICDKRKMTYLENGDVVFASMGVGSLGKTSLFYYEGSKRFVTDSTLRIYRKKACARVLPEVLCIFLQSKVGQELVYRHVVGSTGIINIYDDDITSLPIPILDDDKQKEISYNVQNSFALNYKSKKMLKCIKKAIEIAIEQSEDIAIKWLKEEISNLGV